MAYTVVKYNTVLGNKRVVGLDITADAATQTIETGLKKIDFMCNGESSMNSANIKLAVNSNSSGIQSMGVIGVSGCTSGDRFFVTVFGS